MPPRHEPSWAELVRELQAMAQTGLHFSKGPYDSARYVRIREIATRLTAEGFNLDPLAVGETFAGLSGYATPWVDVRGELFRDGRVLLVRERRDGKWALPELSRARVIESHIRRAHERHLAPDLPPDFD